jgi:serine phosphatase RsbU (regulator of sigma subunit)
LNEIRQSLHEAEICGKIQQQFFPGKTLKHKNGIVCAGKCVPYQNAGGDYYDFFELKNGKIFFFLGDVSGHGISASMITTAAKSIVMHKSLEEDLSLNELFIELNKVLCSMTKRRMMITAVAGLIDTRENKLQMLSGGHLSPILNTEKGFEELVLSGGIPLGIAKRLKVAKIREYDLPEKGFLVLYSDGIIEGVNWKNEQLGFDRFNEIVADMPVDTDSETVISKLYEELDKHVEGRPYEDDVTFLVINFNREKN